MPSFTPKYISTNVEIKYDYASLMSYGSKKSMRYYAVNYPSFTDDLYFYIPITTSAPKDAEPKELSQESKLARALLDDMRYKK